MTELRPAQHYCPHCHQVLPGAFVVEIGNNRATRGGLHIHLQGVEAEILHAIWMDMPNTVNAEKIISRTWGAVRPDFDRNLVSIYVNKLRKKLPELGVDIETVYGRGYRVVVRELGEQVVGGAVGCPR